MSKTNYSSADTETQKLWDEDLYRDIYKESFFTSKMTSTDASSVVHEKTDLEKNKGDNITFVIRYRGNRAFLPSGTPVEGNEGRLDTATDSVTIDEKNFGIRDAGMIARQRPIYEMDSETKRAIVEDGAESVDNEFFTALDSTYSDVVYENTGALRQTATIGTATAAITAADVINPAYISKLKAFALHNRENGRVVLRAIKWEGKQYLVLLANPNQLVDLKLNSTYAQAVRDAEVRGKDNPLFSGAVGLWDGVIVHEHDNIEVATNASSVNYAIAHLLGAQALCSAWAMKPKIVQEEFSYGQEHGYAFLSMWGVRKPRFTKDATAKVYGSVTAVTALGDNYVNPTSA